ncbi:MAG: aminotransferase class I/II-fold pyridoxal phosphate-dependent enzyme [Ruminococcus sp.]|nr:aminotransferase class I/II-fold pyridoxal phosphate-dependent enzyme [Ruminococcus sp.]
MSLKSMTDSELKNFRDKAAAEYEAFKSRGLKLDMSRGKPCPEQLALSMPLLDILNSSSNLIDEGGVDVRNYGQLTGITEMKNIFADILGITPEMIIVGGSSSLNLMYDAVARAVTFGVYGSKEPWGKTEGAKFLCPVPGYDRHFSITETFGFEMINIPMTPEGPDMDMVESLVNGDPTVKGIWCVPIYSNPDGYTYSGETVKRFAALKPAAPDFRIFWDNAYCVHHLKEEHDSLLNIFDEARKNGNEDMIFEFASTSKITFAGAGVSVLAASENNIKQIISLLEIQNISYDKMNQLRHARFFGNADGLQAHMEKHRAILAPKFNLVNETLKAGIGDSGLLTWNVPNGGYFISVNTPDGCAKETVRLCKEAGVVLTGAGATYPYKKDPGDCNIRLSPSFPSLDDLETATELFCVCVKLAAAEKELADRG